MRKISKTSKSNKIHICHALLLSALCPAMFSASATSFDDIDWEQGIDSEEELYQPHQTTLDLKGILLTHDDGVIWINNREIPISQETIQFDDKIITREAVTPQSLKFRFQNKSFEVKIGQTFVFEIKKTKNTQKTNGEKTGSNEN